MRRPAGEYIHPITVRTNTLAPNGSGQLVKTPTDVCTRLARKIIKSATETTLEPTDQTAAFNHVTFGIQWDTEAATIKPSMFIEYESAIYEITSARDVTGLREEIEIEATQRVTP